MNEKKIMSVADRMTATPTTVTPQDSLAAAKALMDAERFRELPVVEHGRLVAIITDRDLGAHTGYWESTRVSAAMKPDPITIAPDARVADAARLLIEHKIGGLPVVQGGKLVGIITSTDLLKAFLDLVPG
ncbi:MAG TPA: CBS domain-containing protein [Candidatus Binataceae bacterium]|jgi:acetoin utilization protein AcuB